MKKPRDVLKGMAEIEALTRRDRGTIRKWIQRKGFPAAKIDGRWQALKREVEAWLSDQIKTANGSA